MILSCWTAQTEKKKKPPPPRRRCVCPREKKKKKNSSEKIRRSGAGKGRNGAANGEGVTHGSSQQLSVRP